ncbi:hypothetical protein APHAL10511_003843 [Amanita phalloides]|nr:hypothetical protein APHAL10511_003843 [Amanita phalloides]
MTVLVTSCSNAYVRELGHVPDALIGTVHYARTGDYVGYTSMIRFVYLTFSPQDPAAPRRGSLNRAIHAIAIVGKASEPGDIYLVAPLSNNWPDTTHKVPASEFVVGGTGEIHVGVPYKIHKSKIRPAHDGGQKSLKPGALERLQVKMQENGASSPPQDNRQKEEESHDEYPSQSIYYNFQHGRRSVHSQNTYGIVGRARL